jgi:hypothetical protein
MGLAEKELTGESPMDARTDSGEDEARRGARSFGREDPHGIPP